MLQWRHGSVWGAHYVEVIYEPLYTADGFQYIILSKKVAFLSSIRENYVSFWMSSLSAVVWSGAGLLEVFHVRWYAYAYQTEINHNSATIIWFLNEINPQSPDILLKEFQSCITFSSIHNCPPNLNFVVKRNLKHQTHLLCTDGLWSLILGAQCMEFESISSLFRYKSKYLMAGSLL